MIKHRQNINDWAVVYVVLQLEKLMCQLIRAIDRFSHNAILLTIVLMMLESFFPQNYVIETFITRSRKLHFAGWDCTPRGKAKDGEGEPREGEECPHRHCVESRQPRWCSGDHRQRGEVPMSSVLESKEMTSNKEIVSSSLVLVVITACSNLEK